MNEMIVEGESGTKTSRVWSYSHNKGGESSHTAGKKKKSFPNSQSAAQSALIRRHKTCIKNEEEEGF